MAQPHPPHSTTSATVPAQLGLLVLVGLAAVGCVEHRTAVNPPLPAAPPPAGESATITQLIAGAKVTDEPQAPVTEASPLPIDVPVSVWRRDSDGTLSRGEFRVTTARPWWQRFPADIVTDLTPIDGEVFASDTATFTEVATVDRNDLYAQAERDGYARREATPKAKDTAKDSVKDAAKKAAPKEAQGKPTP
jgi:hypothetical protein